MLFLCLIFQLYRTMDARIEILPERLLPHRPYELFSCPPHVYDGCHATQLLARQPDCTADTVRRLEACRRRLRVSLFLHTHVILCDQSLTHLLMHTYIHVHVHTHTHTHTHMFPPSLSLCLSCCHTLSRARTHSHTLTHTHSHPHTETVTTSFLFNMFRSILGVHIL